MKTKDRYSRSLIRNLHELKFLISKRNAVNILVVEIPEFGLSFFRYAYYSLKNDLIAHGIKILDKHIDSASFWYLYRCKKNRINKYLADKKFSIDEIEKLSQKLKTVRDKTHFHIDKDGVFDPDKIWEIAGITGNEFNLVFDFLWELLKNLHISQFSEPFRGHIYKGEDIKEIVRTIRNANIGI